MDENNYWLSRIAWEGRITYALLEKGYLPIGFPSYSTRKFIDDVRESGEQALNKAVFAECGELPRNRWFLYYFIKEMQAGDYVLVPKPWVFDVYRIENNEVLCIEDMADVWKDIRLWGNDTVHIGEHGYLCSGTNEEDIVDVGFFRKITPVMLNIPREEYASAGLISRMKYRGTNAKISDLASDIQDAICRYEKQRPINIHNEILEACKPSVLEKLCALASNDQFEELVRQYLRAIGADSVEKPAKNCAKEGCADADAVATFEHLRTIIYVQVKHHAQMSNTNEWAVQQIKEWKEQKSNINDYTTVAWVVSTGTFTQETKEYAAAENVLLIDGEQFAQMLLEAGFKGIQ